MLTTKDSRRLNLAKKFAIVFFVATWILLCTHSVSVFTKNFVDFSFGPIDVAIDRLLIVYIKPPPRDKDLIFIFAGHIVGGQPTLSDESDDVRFFAMNELPENIAPRKRYVINVAGQILPSTAFVRVDLPNDREWLESKIKLAEENEANE